MTTNNDGPVADAAGITPAERDAAVASARQDERDRVRAIVTAEAAEGRMTQALVLATETSLTVGEAEKLLVASPKETGIESLAARAGAGPELGATRDGEAASDASARAVLGWKKAVAAANQRFHIA